MNATANRALSAYASVGLETGVDAADPHKLVLMLYEGALLALSDAKLQMARQDIAAKGMSLSKAITIIENGLKASLDVKAGGELGERLNALYDYMRDRLLRANRHNQPELVDEVSRLLGELRGAWEQIKPAAQQPPQFSTAAGATASAAYRQA
jgi:flagellar protein FliS